MDRPIIFFDIGSTLMDGPDQSPAKRFVADLGLNADDADIINSFLFTKNIRTPKQLVDHFVSHFPGLGKDAPSAITRIWQAQLKEGFPLDGAFNMIGRLAAAGYGLGIISNIWKPYFQCFENVFADYMHHFNVKILSFEAGTVKPDESLFKRAMAEFGRYDKNRGLINPHRVCMTGDSYFHDMEPAMNLGFRTIWILQNQKREMPFMRDVLLKKKKSPDITVPVLDELLGDKFKMLRTLMES